MKPKLHKKLHNKALTYIVHLTIGNEFPGKLPPEVFCTLPFGNIM